MAKRYMTTFKVQGRLPFPTDMLRYDGCVPASEIDSNVIQNSIERANRPECGYYTVTLRHTDARRHWEPCYGRWSSFSWGVVRESMQIQECPV